MRQRGLLLGGSLAICTLGSALAAGAASARDTVAVEPVAFGSCPSLVAYARREFARTDGLPDPAVTTQSSAVSTATSGTTGSGKALPAASASGAAGSSSSGASSSSAASSTGSTLYSTTNDQEPGVDEPDIVKTNGSTIFTIAGDTLYAVAVDSGTPRLVDSLDLGSGGDGAQMLLWGNSLIVISSGGPVASPLTGANTPARAASDPAIVDSPYYEGGQTVLTEIDVSNPAAMAVTQTMTVGGSFVDARQNGSTVRIVISSAPEGIYEPQLRTEASGWVPALQYRNRRTGRHYSRLVEGCGSITRPVAFSGLGMVSVLTINLADGLATTQAVSMMADAQVVYGSLDSLYIATQGWINPLTPYAQLPTQSTVIDRFDVTNPDLTTFVASGAVPGSVLNQFSLSEYNGDLRVATTARPIWWDGVEPPTPSQSYVTVLSSEGDRLVPVGQLSGLGQGEQISSVRFVGESGFVATYDRADPLYAIDLSNPAAPRLAGELELSGYSSYLQPLTSGLLLGIGQGIDPSSGAATGTELDLFNVSNLADPTLVSQVSLGAGSSSAVEYDHHALLYWPPTGLAVLPVEIYGTTLLEPGVATTAQSFVGAMAFRIDASGISEVGQIVQNPPDGSTPTIERALVVGDQVFTVSDEGVLASSLDTLAAQSFVAFPSVQITPLPLPIPLPRPTPLPITQPGSATVTPAARSRAS